MNINPYVCLLVGRSIVIPKGQEVRPIGAPGAPQIAPPPPYKRIPNVSPIHTTPSHLGLDIIGHEKRNEGDKGKLGLIFKFFNPTYATKVEEKFYATL